MPQLVEFKHQQSGMLYANTGLLNASIWHNLLPKLQLWEEATTFAKILSTA
jgi:hypothetical protein